MQNIKLEDSLKLTFCPRCDYALYGLPKIGICPECGDAYNADFLILRGKPQTLSDEPNAQRQFSIWSLVVWAMILPIFWILLRIGCPTPLLLLLAVTLAVEVIQSIVLWSFSTRSGDVVVWLSSVGIGQQPAVDGDSLAGKYLHYSKLFQTVAVSPVAVFVVCFMYSPADVVIEFILLFALVFLRYLIYLGRKPIPALRPSGVRPALLPWKYFEEVKVEELGGRSFQLWAKKLESIQIRSSDVIKIELTASAAGATQLTHLLRQWCEPSTKVSFKVLNRSAGPRIARTAGLMTGRIFASFPWHFRRRKRV